MNSAEWSLGPFSLGIGISDAKAFESQERKQ